MQDYKSPHTAITNCAIMVITQTHSDRQTDLTGYTNSSAS